MLSILNLIEGVVIEDERAEEQRVVELDHLENGDQSWHLIEWDVELSERLAAGKRVKVLNLALRCRQSLQQWAVP